MNTFFFHCVVMAKDYLSHMMRSVFPHLLGYIVGDIFQHPSVITLHRKTYS